VSRHWPTANLVVEEVGTVQLPSAKLPNVTLSAALLWIQHTAEARENGVILQRIREPAEPGIVYLLTTTQSRAVRQRQVPPAIEERRSYSLQPFAEQTLGVTPEIVRMAVTDILEGTGATVQYNRETRMLNVQGSPVDIARATQVVEEITQGRRMSNALAQLTRDVERLRTEIEELRRAIAGRVVP
jgi:hypothetical protein